MAVAVLCSDLVLTVVTSQSILDLPNSVVVAVGDLDPWMFLSDQGFLLLGDEAGTLSPGFVSDGFTNDINRPTMCSSNLYSY